MRIFTGKKHSEFKQKTANSLTHGESWSCVSSTKRGGRLFLRLHETFGGRLNSVVWHVTAPHNTIRCLHTPTAATDTLSGNSTAILGLPLQSLSF